MSIITRGFVDGTIVTRGFSSLGRFIQFIKGATRKLLHGYAARTQCIIKIKGNTKLPLALIINVKAHLSEPYQTVYSLLGNNKITTKEFLSVRGDLRRNQQLLLDSKTSGKKSFKRLILELLLDDET